MVGAKRRCAGCQGWFYPALQWWHDKNCVVVHAEPPVVVHAVANSPVVVDNAESPEVRESRHGKYADPVARREYMRVLMKGKREKARKNRAENPVQGRRP